MSNTIIRTNYFELICDLAKKNNEKALSEIIDVNACVDVSHGIYTCVMWLAKQGAHDAVKLLLERFHANINDATQGYAQAGYSEYVDHLLAKGADRDAAVRGYAIANKVEQVNALLNKGAS